MRRTKAERTEQQNNSRLEISGVLLLALGCFAAAAYFGLPTGTIGAFIDKVMNYTLGKGAFLFPLACIVLGIRFSFSHKGIGFSKKGLALTLLMLCLLGTAHHVFVPVGEELVPEQLKEGGGLLGGTFLLALRRLSGTAGALIILIAGIICSVLLTGKLSLKASAETAGRKAKNIVTYQNSDNETTAETSDFKNMEVLNTVNPYNSDDFAGFTSGIKKESQFKQIIRKAVGKNESKAEDEEAFF